MSALEYLTFLTPGGLMLAQSQGNQKILKWQDVAAAMGMGNLSQEAYLLGLAKYCQDVPAIKGLQKVMTAKSSKLIASRKWKSTRDVSADLAQVACLEALSNHNCKSCRGTGVLIDEPCANCDGFGRDRVSEASKYTLAKMDKRNWQRRWRTRYEEIYQILVAAEDELANHLAYQLQ
ncbi:MAG: hypothetical protein MJK04_04480 [Psychrosphaera sp.]|nr:hypothetical protein [Psychrosphaera sp.]